MPDPKPRTLVTTRGGANRFAREARPGLPKPGDVVAGKYSVDHKLGSGAMSVVYQVTHRVTQKRFALKALLPEVAANEELARRFMREAEVASSLEHPHVVEVYDVAHEGGVYYMVMELLQGESLEERLRRTGALSIAEATRLLLPCFEALDRAHQRGIVHRDLKPANIFVCQATAALPEHAKVLDFGISKLGGPAMTGKQSMTRSGTVMGTPNYMPLEQMRGQLVDARADIYALGVVLYQVLSERLPYRAAHFSDLVLAMASEEPKPLLDVAPDVPAEVARIVHKAMARSPEERHESLRELIDALAPYAGSRELCSPPPLPKPWPQLSAAAPEEPSERSQWPWVAAALLVVMVAGLAAAWIVVSAPSSRIAAPEAPRAQTPAAVEPAAPRDAPPASARVEPAAPQPAEPDASATHVNTAVSRPTPPTAVPERRTRVHRAAPIDLNLHPPASEPQPSARVPDVFEYEF